MSLRAGTSTLNQTTYGYDAAGRLATLGIEAAKLRHYTYVPGTNRIASTKWTAPIGDFLFQNYTYDPRNRLTGISGTVAYTLNNRAQRTRTTLPAGRYWNYPYDNLGQVTDARLLRADGVMLSNGLYSYAYDGIGNRTAATEGSLPPLTYSTNLLNQYTAAGAQVIPLAGRVSADAMVMVKATVGEDSIWYAPKRSGEGFAIDIPVPAVNGSATTQLEVNAVRFDEAQDKELIKTITGTYTTAQDSMSYDADGNLTAWNGWTFTWNGENRLTAMEKGLTRLAFDYDYMGRRIFKKVYADNILIKHVKFAYDGYKLIAEFDALNNDTQSTAYVWQPETAGLDVPVALKNGADWGYIVTDGNKNVIRVVTPDNTALAEYTYGPFGQCLTSAGTWAAVNPFQFSSEYHDEETNLVYYNYRYYSPVLGRWINRDPIEEKGGVNLYAMVGNNIIRRWDALGHAECNVEVKYVDFIDFSMKGVVSENYVALGATTTIFNYDVSWSPVAQKGDYKKMNCSTSCSTTIQVLKNHPKKEENLQHELVHASISELNFSGIIKFYRKMNGQVVCGKKCRNAIEDYMYVVAGLSVMAEEYEQYAFECQDYEDGEAKNAACQKRDQAKIVFDRNRSELDQVYNKVVFECNL